MKKLISSLIVLALLLVVLWGFSSWYLGNKAEQAFKGFLQQSSQLAGKKLFRAELLNYKKSLMGANAKIQISSDYPLLAERFGEAVLNVNIFNGPVFIANSGINVGSSRWVVGLETENNVDLKIDLSELFPSKRPKAEIRVDFENRANYTANFQTPFAESIITGIFNLETEDNRGAINIKKMNIDTTTTTNLKAERIKVSYQHQKAITTSYKPGTASAKISSLKISHKKLSNPLLLDVKINSNISRKNNDLSGFIKVNLKNMKPQNYPFETAKLSLLFNGLSADGFVAYSEANADIDNLHQQAQWTLEEIGELPEGQDQIWQLYDEIEQSAQQLPQALMALGGSSVVQLKAESFLHGDKSQLNGKITIDSNNPDFGSWLSVLKGEATVKLENGLFTALQKTLPLKSSEFTLQLKKNKLLMLQ